MNLPPRLAHLDIPFFDDLHREQAAVLDAWCAQHLQHVDHADTDAADQVDEENQ